MINVGIIGAGYFGELHGMAISQLKDINLLAASRQNEAELKLFTDQFSIDGYRDWRDLLNRKDIDTVLIATPHFLHTEIAVEAADKGKNILLEKPIAPNLPECREIARAVKKNNVNFMAGYSNHFVPTYMKAMEIIESGAIGKIAGGRSAMHKVWMESNRRDWHLNRKKGGGMWLTAGMHCIDRLSWLLGKEIMSTSAHFSTEFHTQTADDFGQIFLRYADGVTGSVQSIGYKHGAPTNETEIFGTEGLLYISSSELIIGIDGKRKTILEFDVNDTTHESLKREWTAFFHSIENNKKHSATIDYSINLMEAVFAAEESSSRKREVSLEEYRNIVDIKSGRL